MRGGDGKTVREKKKGKRGEKGGKVGENRSKKRSRRKRASTTWQGKDSKHVHCQQKD